MWGNALAVVNRIQRHTVCQKKVVGDSKEYWRKKKDLGLNFDPSLMFSKHAAMVVHKANRMVGIIKRTFDFLDENVLSCTSLYKSGRI